MTIEIPFVHLFRTIYNYYVYDVNKNIILRINKNIFKALETSLKKGQCLHNYEKLSEEERNAINNLIEMGFFSGKRIENIVHPANNVLEYYLETKLNKITLQLTQQCNLRCSYCPYSGSYINRRHANKSMSFEIAKKGIDYLLAHSRDTKRINVGFYGGEPLIEFDLMKECLKYASKKAEGKEISFSVTSNATLLNENIIEVFEKYNVQLVISLDGPKNIHDRNRKYAINNCGSFDKVDQVMELIKNKFPTYYKKNIKFNVVIDPTNDFSCTNDFFASYDLVKDSTFMSTQINSEYLAHDINYTEDYTTKINYEIFKLFLYKLNKLKRENVSKLIESNYENLAKLYDKLIPQASLPSTFHHSGPCIPGAMRLFMSIDGTLYPCERVSELSSVMKIGHIDNGFDIEKVRNLLNIGKLSEQSCKNCWAIRFCTLCAVSADNIDSLSSELKQSKCKHVKRNIEENFMDFCAIKELNNDFWLREKEIISAV